MPSVGSGRRSLIPQSRIVSASARRMRANGSNAARPRRALRALASPLAVPDAPPARCDGGLSPLEPGGLRRFFAMSG